LLSTARLNSARSRVSWSICGFVRIAQTCFGLRGGFAPVTFPLFHGIRFAEGIKFAYEALNLTSNPLDRDHVLEDLAALFTEIGLRDAARDTHLLLSVTTQNRYARAQATVNLMELASIDQMPEAFDAYARELASLPLGPWLRSHYLLFLGEGMHRLGRNEASEEALHEAIAYADANQLHQVSFQAQAALSALKASRKSKEFASPPAWLPEEVGSVVRAVSELRKTAVAAA